MCKAHRQAAGAAMEREQPSHLPLPCSDSAWLGCDPPVTAASAVQNEETGSLQFLPE